MLLHFYISELLIRLMYVFASFVLCATIVFFNINTLLLIETYPYLQFKSKQFIVLCSTDLINVIWLLSTSVSFLFVFPFYIYQLFIFFKISWYKYQVWFIKINIVTSVIMYTVASILCYLYVIPFTLEFLSQWEIKYFKSILSVSFSLHIFDYIDWVLSLRYCICYFIFLMTLCITQIYFLLSFVEIYSLMKMYKKQTLFMIILSLFIVFSLDLVLQLFLILNIFILIELVYYSICYVVINSSNY